MGMVLMLDGSTMRDGLPRVWPRGAWAPAWSGGTRKDPGADVRYAGDAASSLLRALRLPRAKYGAPALPPADAVEFGGAAGYPGRPGLLVEDARTQILASADFDFTTWTPTNCSVGSSLVGPTGSNSGDFQAYSLTTTVAGGKVEKTVTVGTSTATDTYVFSCWVRRTSGSGTCRIEVNSGAGTAGADFTVGTRWRRVYVATPNAVGTTPKLRVYPGGSAGSGAVLASCPQLEDTGTAAGLQGRGRSSLISPSGAAAASSLSGPFAWPPAPWTLFAHWQQTWADGDAANHAVLEGSDAAAVTLSLAKNASDELACLLTDYAGASQGCSVQLGSTTNQDAEHRVVVRLSEAGALDGYLDGAAFDSQLAAPIGKFRRPPTTLQLGFATGSGRLGGVVRRLEVHDRALEPERFF